MVPPGAMPGRSTPFNPMQMAQPAAQLPPVPRPGNFGTPGQTAIPQRQPVSLANLGQSIQQTVQSRIGAANQGVRPGVSPATPGSPVGNSLDDLGDRIRAAVAGNQGNVQPAAPAGGVGNLGPATQSIMDRVRQQIAQAGVGQPLPPMTNGTTPFPTQPGGGLNVPTAPGGPSTGTMPGGAPVPPGGTPTTPGAAPAPPPSAPAGSIGAPQGTISCSMGFGCGGSWDAVNQYDNLFVTYGQKYGVDPAMLKAMAVIESGGQMIANQNGFPNYGIMQLTTNQMSGGAPTKWDNVAAKLGVDIMTPEGQVAVAAYVLGGHDGDAGSPEEIFLSTYYPTPCLTCPGQDGNTPQQYLDSMHGLMNDINAANPGAGTTPTPTGTPGDQTTGAPIPPAGPTSGVPAPPQGPPNVAVPPVVEAPPDVNNVPAPPGSFTLPPQGEIIQMPDASAQQIVDIARLYVGVVPYESLDIWNGNPGAGVDPRDPAQHGWDCSGMVYWMDQNYGTGNIPEGSHEQYNYFLGLEQQGLMDFTGRAAAVSAGDYSSLKVGDIVYMDTGASTRGGNNASHVAVYIGNGQFINAANPSEGTTIWNGLNGYQVLGVATYW